LFNRLHSSVKDIVTDQFIKQGQQFLEQKQSFKQAMAAIEQAKRQEQTQLQRTIHMLRKLYNG
jgi:hypothetical protein